MGDGWMEQNARARMTDSVNDDLEGFLEPGEAIEASAQAIEGLVAVTDRRLVVAAGSRAVAIPWERLRRVELDIERDRPATLVLVPEWPSDPPQVLSVPPESYREVAVTMARIAERLAGFERTG